MTDDPRKPKIIIPQDANFMTALKHKQALAAAAQKKTKEELPILDGIFIQGSLKTNPGRVYPIKDILEAVEKIKKDKEAKNG